ncbi:plant intracellular Ras-group-related LRR protein 5-like, partial [Prunus avium]|uniref:Plant intracellular Ras-group-related LRR protein 5-like n=1 Tax=Prunus avium TaxID=42229 RepID=A0A6P5RFQ7_PRUAV
VEAAQSVLKTVNGEEEKKLEEISKQEKPENVPEELFSVFQEVKKTMVLFQSQDQRKEAAHVVEMEGLFQTFDDLIQTASGLVSGDTQVQKHVNLENPGEKIGRETVISDESLTMKKEDKESERDGFKSVVRSASTLSSVDSEKMSLMKVAAVIENTAKSGAVVLDLKGKLEDRVEWLPISLGKLSEVTELDFSENRIMALPPTM